MYGDNFKIFTNPDIFLAYTPDDYWIGLRRISTPTEEKRQWENRKLIKQQYQFNFLPCLAFGFMYKKSVVLDPKLEKKKVKIKN